MVTAHKAKLVTPYYADPGDGTMLHRYLDDAFVQRFNQEASAGKLTGTSAQAWRERDRFGAHAGEHVTLRLPIHRTFYMVSCEVSCDQIGTPAFDPLKVVSAGMVVRRGSPEACQSWQVREGVALGWQEEGAAEHEPDINRRLSNRGLIKPKNPAPLYSGEQTHPLYPLLIERQDEKGRSRKHTLLSGYLPLGGTVDATLLPTVNQREIGSAQEKVSSAGQLAEQAWPFGSWDGVSSELGNSCTGSLEQVAGEVCGNFDWNQATGLQIDHGIPTPAFALLLRTLIERYHISDRSISENEALRNQLQQLNFYHGLSVDESDGDLSLIGRHTHGNFLEYIEGATESLLNWYAEKDFVESGGDSDDITVSDHLPDLHYDLYITEQQARSIRELMVLRAEQAEQIVEEALPLPRYGQAEDDTYFLRPFVRYLDECGKEQITWGPVSKPFRVVSMMDPEAVRPSVIQLPELGDIKRGFAKGVTFLTPKSLADIMEQMTPTAELGVKNNKKKNRLSACLGFSLSFSIPIITICAMILLMIIINILNIFLKWLPWAFMKLPRRC